VTTVDPATVPPWPAPTIAITDDGAVLLDGAALLLPHGLNPVAARQRALEAVAAQYADLRRPVRVTAVDPDGTSWQLILHPDGSTQPLDPAPTGRRRLPGPADKRAAGPRAPSQARGLIAAAVFLLVIALIAGVVIAATSGGHSPVAAPHPTTSASVGPAVPGPANLPVPAPAGYSTRAVWATALAPDTSPAVSADGSTIALITAQNRLAVLDPATGTPRWTTTLPDQATGTLVITTIDRTTTVVLLTSDHLYAWPVTGPQHPVTSIALPAQAAVSFVGPSPLVTLPDQTAAVITGGTLRTLDVPVGTTALSANGTTITAADSGHWQLLTPGHSPTAPRTMTPPTPGARLLRVLAVDGPHLLTAWTVGTAQRVVLYDTATGRATATATADSGLDQAPACAGPTLLAFGPLVIDLTNGAVRHDLTISTCQSAGTHLYVQDTNQAWYDAAVGTDTPLPSGAPVPAGTADGRALVVADKLDQHLLYALPPGVTSGGDSGAIVNSPAGPGQ
jgi:outer membrane protein assembly factor BamB